MFSVSISGQQVIVNKSKAVAGYVMAAIAEANQLTADEMVIEAQRQLKANDTIVTGDLYNSLQTEASQQGLRMAVGSTSEYAPYVEFGTGPHFPPPDAIRAWCRMRGIPDRAVWPICLKIAREGTPEQPFLWPAYRLAIRGHLTRARALISAALRRV